MEGGRADTRREARGGDGAAGGGVSIQLPRISSARGDSPPRVCHLRGVGGREGGREGEIANGCNGARRQVCPKYYDNIYPNVRVRVADSEASIAPDRRCTRL